MFRKNRLTKSVLYHKEFGKGDYSKMCLSNISNEKNGLWIGSLFILFFGIDYSVVAIIWYFLGALPDNPFISIIPVEKWYFIQAFTTIL